MVAWLVQGYWALVCETGIDVRCDEGLWAECIGWVQFWESRGNEVKREPYKYITTIAIG